ncbi:protein of unknown function (plasmid) [Azospirillum lipoferum 4B]|uniref:Uncharacterized protein n=1 Tax=Azospirillum lipoferum (strain 4B) TaxID=862719 RepID=G7ZF16_AZOL4|nr:protein of unknown function [Azospirillum lipoferum 4B]
MLNRSGINPRQSQVERENSEPLCAFAKPPSRCLRVPLSVRTGGRLPGPPNDRNSDKPKGGNHSRYNFRQDTEGAHNPANPVKTRPEVKSGKPCRSAPQPSGPALPD